MRISKYFILVLVSFGIISVGLPAAYCGGLEHIDKVLANRTVPGEIIVKMKAQTTSAKLGAVAQGVGVSADVVGEIQDRNLYRLKLRGVLSEDKAIAALKRDPSVAAAFQNIIFQIPENTQTSPILDRGSLTPPSKLPLVKPILDKPQISAGKLTNGFGLSAITTNDPLSEYQWYLFKIKENISTAGLGATPIVAVVDTGVGYSYCYSDGTSALYYPADLYGKVIPGFDFVNNTDCAYDDHGHGSHVAGEIAALRNNAVGIRGIANTKILGVKVLDNQGGGTWFQVMQGISYANQRLDELGGASGSKGIINMSLGGMADPNDEAYVEMRALLAEVSSNNKLVVVSAGNDNDETYTYCQSDPDFCGGYLTYIPAAFQPYVLSVAASDPFDFRAYFSNTNPLYTNIAAPGRFNVSTVGDAYEWWSGTSMAAPVVSGTAARSWATSPTATAASIRARLLSRGPTLTSSKGWPTAGIRRVDLASDTTVTSIGFSGYVVTPEAGDWYAGQITGLSQPLTGVTITVKDGTTTVATTKTNATGFFTVEGLTASKAYNLTASKVGYATTSWSDTTFSTQLKDTPTTSPLYLYRTRTASAAYVEYLLNLTWDSVEPYSAACGAGLGSCTSATTNRGSELDMYLQRPDGSVIYYNNVGDYRGTLLRDSWPDMMPGEAMYIKKLMPAGSTGPGIYKLAVHRYSYGQMYTVHAKVTAFKGASNLGNRSAPAACANTATDDWWIVATINPATGTLTWVNTCQDVAPF